MAPVTPTDDVTRPAEEWAIIYRRPDGWWVAGEGFRSSDDAIDAALNDLVGSQTWRVVRSTEAEGFLCAAAVEARHETRWPQREAAP